MYIIDKRVLILVSFLLSSALANNEIIFLCNKHREGLSSYLGMVHINEMMTLNQLSVFICDVLEYAQWVCLHILFGKKSVSLFFRN